MKRYLIRLAALSVIVVLAVVVITQAQRALRKREAIAASPPGEAAESPSPAAANAHPSNSPDKSSLWNQSASVAQEPAPFHEVPPATAAPPSSIAAAAYTEAQPDSSPQSINDNNVLQVVSEAQLSPTPTAGAGDPAGLAPAQNAPLESPPAEISAEPPLDESARQRLEAHGESGYVPARMAADRPLPLEGRQAAAAPSDAAGSPFAERAEAADARSIAPADALPDAPDNAPDNSFEAPPSAALSTAQEGTGRPGGRELEGTQGASLSVEKVAPAELQVGRPATFQIKVRNTGTAPAKDVQVLDLLPKGARLGGTNPPAEQASTGELVWNLGRLRPGEESVVSLEIIPLVEGEIGSIATARFAAEASARSVATRPQLAVQISGPTEVLIGQEARIRVKVANVGTGAAAGVTLSEQLPPNFTHPAGHEVEYSVGLLGPNESREVDLTLTAAKPGRAQNTIVAYAEGNLRAEDQAEIEVLAPSLQLTIQGSERRFLERQAVYTLAIANPGTAPAKNIDLHARLPEGLQFVEANNLGEYEAGSRTVHWRLDELPPGESGSVKLITMPSVEGDQSLAAEAKTSQGLSDRKEQRVVIEGVAGVSFEVVDVNDPIEMGGETTYEIRVINQGTKAATNIRLAVLLPDGMKPIDGQGPTAHLLDGGQVMFEPLARLAAKADSTYQVRASASQAGDMRVRVQLLSDEMRTPVTKEESTRVFGDE